MKLISKRALKVVGLLFLFHFSTLLLAKECRPYLYSSWSLDLQKKTLQWVMPQSPAPAEVRCEPFPLPAYANYRFEVLKQGKVIFQRGFFLNSVHYFDQDRFGKTPQGGWIQSSSLSFSILLPEEYLKQGNLLFQVIELQSSQVVGRGEF